LFQAFQTCKMEEMEEKEREIIATLLSSSSVEHSKVHVPKAMLKEAAEQHILLYASHTGHPIQKNRYIADADSDCLNKSIMLHDP